MDFQLQISNFMWFNASSSIIWVQVNLHGKGTPELMLEVESRTEEKIEMHIHDRYSN